MDISELYKATPYLRLDPNQLSLYSIMAAGSQKNEREKLRRRKKIYSKRLMSLESYVTLT
jgi:hypothetical protein